MPVPSLDAKCGGCKRTDAYTDNSWHAVSYLPLSGRHITDRHNRVLAVIARFCRLMLYNVRTEPTDLCNDSERRPDIQIDLPDKTILGDVTITHSTARTWRKVVVTRAYKRSGMHGRRRRTTSTARWQLHSTCSSAPLFCSPMVDSTKARYG